MRVNQSGKHFGVYKRVGYCIPLQYVLQALHSSAVVTIQRDLFYPDVGILCFAGFLMTK
jgi:hypothetical protein